MVISPRERVQRMFCRQETDRTPVDFGGTVVTCMDCHAHDKLKRHFSIRGGDDPIIDYSMGTVEPCEELKVLFGSDFRRVAMNAAIPDIRDNEYVNGFGIRMRKAEPHGYFDVTSHPLAGAGVGGLDELMMPDPDDAALYAGLKDRARDLFENSGYAIVADFGVPGFYETSQKLRGYDNIACDLLINKEFVFNLYDRLLDLQKRFFKNYLDNVGSYAQVVCYADDLGMQDRLQISPDTYREMIKPYHRRIFSFIHERTDAKILLHSCGAIEPIINDLIEIGVDILNPVQTRAKGMDPIKLKQAYGSRIIFWGGIDEQRLLPYGSPEEVSREVCAMMRTLGDGGGYVLGPSHNFQEDTPVENVIAMYEAARRENCNGKP